jgi:alkylation response protein AidB-like acyl-CoA dehydrogenase
VIVSTARSPIGRAYKGSLKDMRADDLTVQMVRAALAKVPELDPTQITDLMLGCGLPGGEQGQNMGRNVTLKAAWLMDTQGNRAAHGEIQAIKIASPTTVQWIVDKAIQVHGGGGLSQDFPLAYGYALARMLRFVDSPDEVHKDALARSELRRSGASGG